jgi:hypothetical protein
MLKTAEKLPVSQLQSWQSFNPCSAENFAYHLLTSATHALSIGGCKNTEIRAP